MAWNARVESSLQGRASQVRYYCTVVGQGEKGREKKGGLDLIFGQKVYFFCCNRKYELVHIVIIYLFTPALDLVSWNMESWNMWNRCPEKTLLEEIIAINNFFLEPSSPQSGPAPSGTVAHSIRIFLLILNTLTRIPPSRTGAST